MLFLPCVPRLAGRDYPGLARLVVLVIVDPVAARHDFPHTRLDQHRSPVGFLHIAAVHPARLAERPSASSLINPHDAPPHERFRDRERHKAICQIAVAVAERLHLQPRPEWTHTRDLRMLVKLVIQPHPCHAALRPTVSGSTPSRTTTVPPRASDRPPPAPTSSGAVVSEIAGLVGVGGGRVA